VAKGAAGPGEHGGPTNGAGRGGAAGTRSAPGRGEAATGGALSRNRQRVLEALARCPGLTRSDLAHQLGIPKGTVSGVVDSLVRSGRVIEQPPEPPAQARPGRPAKRLVLEGPVPVLGAVVLSGGYLSAAALSYAGHVLSRATARLSRATSEAGMTAPALALLSGVLGGARLHKHQLKVVVVGVPAPIQPGSGVPRPGRAAQVDSRPGGDEATGRQGLGHDEALAGEGGPPAAGRPRPAFFTWLGTDPAQEVGERLGVPAVSENDANLGALGEAAFGAGQGLDSFVYLKLVGQVGAGIVAGGRLHRGASGFAGELGHLHVRDDGPLCPCGGRGCLSHLLGDALVEAVQPAYDRPLSFRDVLDLAAAGEAGPRRVLEDLGRTIGRPLADFVTLFNPEAVIVDGSLGPAGGHVASGIQEMIGRFAAPSAARAVEVIAGGLAADADLLGAVALGRALAVGP